MIAVWLRPMLWGARDWDQALARVVHATGAAGGDRAATAAALGAACEHVVPDRRRAVAAYATGGPTELARARALAVELAWWPAVARLALAERAVTGAAVLAVDEFGAWLDAGEPGLAAMVAAEACAAAPTDPWLPLIDTAVRGGAAPLAIAERIAAQGGDDPRAALAIVRLARLGGDRARVHAQLARAVAAAPHDPTLVALALHELDDEAALNQLVRAQLHDHEPAAWVAIASRLGRALIARPGLRGLGLRLIRAALTLTYQDRLPIACGHLALWATLDAHATASGARPALLGLAQAALAHELPADDRLWLAALGTDVALEAGAVEVAQAWAAVVAELAPDHPSVLAAASALAEPIDDGLVYLDRAHEAPATSSRSLAIDPVLAALRGAAERVAAAASIDIPMDDLHESGPVAAEAAIVATAAVATTSAAVAATPAAPPRGLIPDAARAALRPRGALPPLPPIRARPDARPRAPRIALPLDATIERAEHAPLTVVCRDISATGLFVITDARLALGSTVDVTVETPADEAWAERRFRTRARVVRRESHGYGLELVAPPAELVAEVERLEK